MAGIPGLDPTPYYQKKWFAELIGSIPPIVAIVIAAIINLNDSDPTKRVLSWIGFCSAGWLLIASAVKIGQARRQDQKEDSTNLHDGLTAALTVIHAEIAHNAKFSTTDMHNGRLRVTMHRVVPNEAKLEQLVSYVGGDGGEVGRRFSIQSGIIGKAIREKKPFVGTRRNDNYAEYIGELVSFWSYTEEDAKKLSQDRMSWLAVPIFYRNKKAEAVVYLDSAERGFFDQGMINLVTYACAGIASYCEEKYK